MDINTDSINIKGTQVTAFGTVLDCGEEGIVNHGHCWATHNNPEITDPHSELGSKTSTGSFNTILNSIKPGVTHYVRSYIYDGEEYHYGQEASFEISADDIEFVTIGFNKVSPTAIVVKSATTGIGSMNFSDYGHCWSQINPPTINDNKSSYGEYQADKEYVTHINNLIFGRYYIRGYLESDGIVIYTNTLTYESEIFLETGSTFPLENHAINAEGTVVCLGVKPIIDHGHCWSATNPRPNFNNSKSSLGGLFYPGSYNSTITGLNTGVTYYIRAFASDGTNIYYGEVKSFVAN